MVQYWICATIGFGRVWACFCLAALLDQPVFSDAAENTEEFLGNLLTQATPPGWVKLAQSIGRPAQFLTSAA